MSGPACIGDVVPCDGMVWTIEGSATVADAARAMQDHDIACLVVCTPNGQIAGIVTERDITRRVAALGRNPRETSVAQILTRQIAVATPRTTLEKVLLVMLSKSVRHVPIVDGSKLVGMASIRDVLSRRLEHAELVIEEQSALLRQVEQAYPGLTKIRKDEQGRVLI